MCSSDLYAQRAKSRARAGRKRPARIAAPGTAAAAAPIAPPMAGTGLTARSDGEGAPHSAGGVTPGPGSGAAPAPAAPAAPGPGAGGTSEKRTTG